MGRILWAPEVFNCSAPDVGNMEVLANYGTPAQQERWLKPLLEGRIRSGFSMTEPQVASSDATNIQCEIKRDGGDYVINGRKWFTSGAMNEDCEILIVMGKTAPDDPDRHRQQSMILVPRATPGVRIVRDMLTLRLSTTRRSAIPRSSTRTFACPPRTSCSARAAASRSRKAGSAPAASIIACG